MKQLNPFEVIQTLYNFRKDNNSLEEKVELLTELVLTLLVEVEALRSAQIQSALANNQNPAQSSYGQAYVDTMLLSHNEAGPTPGIQKVLAHWFDPQKVESRYHSYFREILMLERLGFTKEEIERIIAQAEFNSRLS